MKLLLKTRRTGTKSKNEIKISKTTVSFKGNSVERFNFNKRKENYTALGLDESGNLCIYYSGKQHEGFLKLYKSSKVKSYYSISINGENKKIIEPFHGSYEIAEISIDDRYLGIFKAKLIKIG